MGFGKKRSSRNVGVGAITTNKKKLFAEGGMMDDGKDVDPVSGNDVPVGSLAEEVRDDVDAKLSPGEFVFPADVVRFIGLERLMQMRDQAKKGLMRMNDIGQMGNAEEAGANANDTYEEEDDNFESDIDEIIKDVSKTETERQTEQAFNVGGFVNPTYYDLTKAPKNPALDIRYFKDSAGKDFYMPFINGKPMKPMPNGATQIGGPPTKTNNVDEDTTGTAATTVVGGVGSLTNLTNTTGTTTQQQQVSDAQNAGASSGISGVYTGENLADFGRADMIYNPGGSGPSGEIVTEDLWNSSISSANVKLGTTVLSTLASAMGVPGIVTLPIRLAINKYGADAVNAYLGRLNQEMVGASSGVDTSTPEGRAAASSQIDQITDRDSSKPAASSGAIGTGSIAAQASGRVADILKDTGLSDEDIGSLSQRAANAIISGADINLAINNAKTAAVDVIYATKILNGEDVTREQIAKSLFGGQIDVEQPTESGDTMTGDSSSKEGEDGEGEKISGFDPRLFELRIQGEEDYYRNIDQSFDFWGSDTDALFGDFGGFSGGGGLKRYDVPIYGE